MKKKLVLIDGMSLLHRAFHAYPITLTTKDGELTNAVYGFTSILLNVLEKLQPTHVAVAWDVGKPTFRHEAYEDYKANRQKPDDLLLGQIDRTKEVVETLNIPQFGKTGFEADDLIGTLSVKANEDKEAQVTIVTGDHDALQLIKDDKVIVWMPASSGRFVKDRGPQIYDEFAVETKYHLKPKQIIDLKALMGDPSDNIPGVKGVGAKTAEKLLVKYSSVENLYKALDSSEGREDLENYIGIRVVSLLEKDREMAKKSKELATIDLNVPIKLDWKACQLNDYNQDEVIKLFTTLQFKSLLNKLPKDHWEQELEGIFS